MILHEKEKLFKENATKACQISELQQSITKINQESKEKV